MSFYSIAPFIERYYPQYYSIERYPADECVTIHKVKEAWGIFSNFAPAPLVVNGVTFRNSEQLFQLMKFRDKEAVLAVYHGQALGADVSSWGLGQHDCGCDEVLPADEVRTK